MRVIFKKNTFWIHPNALPNTRDLMTSDSRFRRAPYMSRFYDPGIVNLENHPSTNHKVLAFAHTALRLRQTVQLVPSSKTHSVAPTIS